MLILERADASLVQKGVPSLILEDDLTRQLRSMAADAAQAPCQAVFDLNEFNELTGLEASFWLFDCSIDLSKSCLSASG